MAKSRARRRSSKRKPVITRAVLAALQRGVLSNAEDIDRLRRDVEIQIKRMGTMQAEIDQLRKQLL